MQQVLKLPPHLTLFVTVTPPLSTNQALPLGLFRPVSVIVVSKLPNDISASVRLNRSISTIARSGAEALFKSIHHFPVHQKENSNK